jgi:multicomponent Na+:H+ antiporter subunit B
MAAVFTQLDAVDVAFTEASVGAGISTVLLLATLALIKSQKAASYTFNFPAVLLTTVTGALLLYTVPAMPLFGNPSNPIHQHVAPRYINETPETIGIPNIVTSVLADYRGFDTLGEVAVIFTAGVGVLLLLGRRRSKKQ